MRKKWVGLLAVIFVLAFQTASRAGTGGPGRDENIGIQGPPQTNATYQTFFQQYRPNWTELPDGFMKHNDLKMYGQWYTKGPDVNINDLFFTKYNDNNPWKGGPLSQTLGTLRYNPDTNSFAYSSGTPFQFGASHGVCSNDDPFLNYAGYSREYCGDSSKYGNAAWIVPIPGGPQVQWVGSSQSVVTTTGKSIMTLVSGGSPFTVNVTKRQVDINKEYKVTGYAVVDGSPIILDLDGTGEPDVSYHDYLPHAPRFYTDRTVLFDILGTGNPQLSEWVGPNAGILCTLGKDKNVASVRQLFGNAGGWSDGYQKLRVLFGKNKENVISGDELNGLYVWTDKNGNGKVDPGEVVSVQSLGIVKISARADQGPYTSWYELKDGTRRKTWDWWPSLLLLNKVERPKY